MRRVVPVLLAGCLAIGACGGSPAPDPSPMPSAVPSAGPSPAPAPTGTPDEQVCADYRDTESIVRRTAEAMQQMPVLPAGVALVLVDSRRLGTLPGVTDPELREAQAELVAAIDDLDAQGRAGLGPDGNPVQDAVQLDAARILAAVSELERVCGA